MIPYLCSSRMLGSSCRPINRLSLLRAVLLTLHMLVSMTTANVTNARPTPEGIAITIPHASHPVV